VVETEQVGVNTCFRLAMGPKHHRHQTHTKRFGSCDICIVLVLFMDDLGSVLVSRLFPYALLLLLLVYEFPDSVR
jgi:hypothetical protein